MCGGCTQSIGKVKLKPKQAFRLTQNAFIKLPWINYLMAIGKTQNSMLIILSCKSNN